MSCSHNVQIACKSSQTLSIESLTEFQGRLKFRSDSDIVKIKESIIAHGFSFPFFVWKKGGVNFVLDGHGRLETLKRMQSEGWDVPPLPIVYVSCKDENDAKDLLLRLNSHYGKMSKETVLSFLGDEAGFDFSNYQLPGIENIDFSQSDFEERFAELESENPMFSAISQKRDDEALINCNKVEGESTAFNFMFGEINTVISKEEYDRLKDAYTSFVEKNNGVKEGFIYELFGC